MTMRDRFERELPGLLEEVYLGPTPAYRDDILSLTARTRQRPGWTLPERWLPMETLTQRTAAIPPVPWRTIAAVALFILALVAGAMLIAGNQQRTRLPAPFGPAANGHVAHAANGDIYIVDPVTGEATAIVTGPDADQNPVWSRDGTHLVFERITPGEANGQLYVARADGSDLTRITPERLSAISSYSFSPDGREVIFSSGTVPGISIAKVDGSGVRSLDVGMPAEEPAYRPPNGAQIAFTGFPTDDSQVAGVYVVNADGSGLLTLVEGARDNTVETPRWSPDGSLLSYGVADFTVQAWTERTHVIGADGTNDRTLPLPPDALWGGGPVWSNDGTRIAMVRGYSVSGDADVVVAVVPADGSGLGVATDRSMLTGWPLAYEWAPDDTSILLTPKDGPGEAASALEHLILDPQTAELRTPPWAATGGLTWQRIALEDR